ncbi:MAG: hypothetical protein WKF47_13645 [Geodermatophilaceae bacterium]
MLDPTFHPGRSGRNHLRSYSAAAGIPDKRADEVLDQVGLGTAGRRKAGGYSSVCASGWGWPRRCSAIRGC